MISDIKSNIYEQFQETVYNFSSKTAITFKKELQYKNLSFDEIKESSIKLGNLLLDSNVRYKDNVCIVLDNQPEFSFCFLAIIYTGATAVPVDTQYSIQQIKNILAHSESKIIITNKKYQQKLSIIEDVKFIVIDDPESQNLIDEYSNENNYHRHLNLTDTAILFYTSGTTDIPKGVLLTHKNLLSNFESINDLKLVTKTDTIISLLPLHHAYSFTVTLLTPLLTGATIVYPHSIASTDLISCLNDTKTTIFVGVPQVFSILNNSIRNKINKLPKSKIALITIANPIFNIIRKSIGINLNKNLFSKIHATFGGNLRFLVSGGARLDESVARSFYNLGFTMLEGYGLTETSPVVTFNPIKKPTIGSVGKPLKNVEIKIDNPNEKNIGEVLVRGPNVMAGYYHMEKETQSVIKNDWFYTGDLGYIDKKGYLFLTGRKKEVIVLSSGKNIIPENVEQHYIESPYIKEICVLSSMVTNKLEGVDHLVAVIVIDQEHFKATNVSNIKNQIKWEIDNLSTRLPTYKRIKGFEITNEPLPRTRLGKLMRHQVAEIYKKLNSTAKASRSENKVETLEGITSSILISAFEFLKETVKKDISLNDHLELDLGLDSLGRIELLLGIAQKFNINISDDDAMEFFMCNTVGELLEKFKKILPKEELADRKKETTGIWAEQLSKLPTEETLNKIQLKQNLINKIFNIFIILSIKIFFKIFFFLKVEGKSNLKQEGPYLICPNHESYLDAVAVLAALDFKTALNTYFVGYNKVFERFLLKLFAKSVRLIPIEINFNLVEALRTCSFVLKNSKIICYFPEGERSIDGKIKDFKKGVGILINEVKIPVIPTFIEGTFEAWPRTKKFPKPHKITVKFGEIISNDQLISKETDKDIAYKTSAKTLMNRISNMSDQ